MGSALFFLVELEFQRLEFHWGIFFFFKFPRHTKLLNRQTRNWEIAENIIHKHLLRGREAENVNVLKLHQKGIVIGTKL